MVPDKIQRKIVGAYPALFLTSVVQHRFRALLKPFGALLKPFSVLREPFGVSEVPFDKVGVPR